LRIVLVEQEPSCRRARRCAKPDRARAHRSLADERDRWRADARLTEFLHRLGVDPERTSGQLLRRRAQARALALALALQPDLLLLDEPTNHLDIDGIARSKSCCCRSPTSIVITHDRAFLDRVVTRIIELDRGCCAASPATSPPTRRARASSSREGLAHRKFDKFWAQEGVWIRRGIEARRTRNEGACAARALRDERAARRERLGIVKLTLDAGERSGKLVAELDRRRQELRRARDRRRTVACAACAAIASD
jgi:ATP-binding cassette subfamily F protein uup